MIYQLRGDHRRRSQEGIAALQSRSAFFLRSTMRKRPEPPARPGLTEEHAGTYLEDYRLCRIGVHKHLLMTDAKKIALAISILAKVAMDYAFSAIAPSHYSSDSLTIIEI
jgi:hypothetical protein